MKSKKWAKVLVILLSILLGVLIVVGAVMFFLRRNEKVKEPPIVFEYTSLEKIRTDYEAGGLSVSEYFEQLVALEYFPDALSPRYASDSPHVYVSGELPTLDLIGEHYEELDEDLVKAYLSRAFSLNLHLGEETDEPSPEEGEPELLTAAGTGFSAPRASLLLAGEQPKTKTLAEDKSMIADHNLDKVQLSSRGHFLVWYTQKGDDAVTDNQVQTVLNMLEDTLSQYEQIFGVTYSFSPFISDEFSILSAENTLRKNNLSPSLLTNTMNVYLYDTGSENVLAAYVSLKEYGKVATWTIRFLGLSWLMTSDGTISYPYIRINTHGDMAEEKLKGVVAHELFHHFQALYAAEQGQEDFSMDGIITEGMANFASAMVNADAASEILNGWAGTYRRHSAETMYTIGVSQSAGGYAIFPYLYSYARVCPDGTDLLMQSQLSESPSQFLLDSTDKQVLMDVVRDLGFSTLAQDYENLSLRSDAELPFQTKLSTHSFAQICPAGAVLYHKVPAKWRKNITVSVQTEEDGTDVDYLSASLIGKKGEEFFVLQQEDKELVFSAEDNREYDELYLMVTNGDPVHAYRYTVDMGDDMTKETGLYVIVGTRSYSMSLKLHSNLFGLETDMNLHGTVDETHRAAHVTADVGVEDFSLDAPVEWYWDFNREKMYFRVTMFEKYWLVQEEKSEYLNHRAMTEQFLQSKDVVKVEEGHYQMRVSKDETKSLLDMAGSETPKLMKGKIYADVYVENGYVTRIEFDLSDNIIGYSDLTLVIEYSDFDAENAVIVPQYVISTAHDSMEDLTLEDLLE